jgi:hypothetical protein
MPIYRWQQTFVQTSLLAARPWQWNPEWNLESRTLYLVHIVLAAMPGCPTTSSLLSLHSLPQRTNAGD